MTRTRPIVITLVPMLAVVAAVAVPRAQTSASYEPLCLYLEAVSLVHEQYVDLVSWDRLADPCATTLLGHDASVSLKMQGSRRYERDSIETDGRCRQRGSLACRTHAVSTRPDG